MEPKRLILYTERRVRGRRGERVVQLCHFYPSPTLRSAELVAACPWSELVLLAEKLENGVRLKRRSVRVGDRAYRRLLVYAAVRESLSSRHKVRELEEVVRSLDEYELFFWFSRFTEAFERGRLRLRRPVRAFKVLQGLD
ncbi:MAG: hypothetical protein ABWK01_02195 [Infirmifilum sp.]